MNDEAAVRKGELGEFVPERVENTKYFKPNGRDWGKIERIKWSGNHWKALETLKENGNQPVRASVVWPGGNMIHFDVMRGGINKIFRMNDLHYRLQFTGDITSPTKMVVLYKVLSAVIRRGKRKKREPKKQDGEINPKLEKFLDKLERERRKRMGVRSPRHNDYFDIGVVLPNGEEVVRNTIGE